MNKIYDLIIIGAGPAGITAGIYAVRKGVDTLVLTGDIGGQTAWSGDIENYVGYQFITGTELTAKFEEHMKKYGIVVKEQEEMKKLEKKDDIILVHTAKDIYQTRTVIAASGKRSRPLDVPGEKEYRNKGVAYCATCDAPLFAGKDVAIIGGGNSAVEAALQLVKIASYVYVVNITSEIGGDAIMREKVVSSSNVTILNDSRVTEIAGSNFVESIGIETDGKKKQLKVQGVFVEIGLIPNSEFESDLEKNEWGEIKVNCYNETNVPGIFAAGDVTDVPEKQIIIAAGEGAKAALSVFKYLARQEK